MPVPAECSAWRARHSELATSVMALATPGRATDECSRELPALYRQVGGASPPLDAIRR
jgi:hypothetical protein